MGFKATASKWKQRLDELREKPYAFAKQQMVKKVLHLKLIVLFRSLFFILKILNLSGEYRLSILRIKKYK